MTTVFFSYARYADELFVKRLRDDLTSRGVDAWFDRDSISTQGLTFNHEIGDAIRERIGLCSWSGRPLEVRISSRRNGAGRLRMRGPSFRFSDLVTTRSCPTS